MLCAFSPRAGLPPAWKDTGAWITLVRELQRAIGSRYVLSRPQELLVYEYDGAVERALPGVVAVPGSAAQAAQVVAIARRHGVPVVPRGAGTGLSGGAIPVHGGILMPMTPASTACLR